MIITFVGKGIDLTEALKNTIEKKVERLDKYFTKDTPINITLSTQKHNQRIEVTIPVKGNLIRAEYETQDMYRSIDLVMDILERQLRKYRNKIQNRKYAQISKDDSIGAFKNDLSSSDENVEIVISKRKVFDFKPMTPEEACLQMELLQHQFFAFNNANTGRTEVVYRRKDGTYGLIEQE
ncbi:MAG: ribosome-associated translation inhibitor RaiA [Eubacteriales bacterium]|nr:ribosome-associated translation inhibitor RaiA [Eubacteriales bacterium]